MQLKKSNKKNIARLKRLNRQIIGLKMVWSDDNPLEHKPILPGAVKCTRRGLLPSQAFKLWRDHMQYISQKSRWKWRLKIECMFLMPDLTTIVDELEIIDSFMLVNAGKLGNDEIMASIEDTKKDYPDAVFAQASFSIECIGFPESNKVIKSEM